MDNRKKEPKNEESSARHSWIVGDYEKAAELYEMAISESPEEKENYWHLGLMLLLQGQEEDAHAAWLTVIMSADEEEIELRTAELVQVLEAEARRQAELGENSQAWLVRQHIREIDPTDIDNLLDLMKLAIGLENLTEENIVDWGIVELLREAAPGSAKTDKLLQALRQLLDYAPVHPLSLEFVECCLPHLPQSAAFRDLVLGAAVKIAYGMGQPTIAISLAELCLKIDVRHPEEILGQLVNFYYRNGDYDRGIERAKQCYSLNKSLAGKIFAKHLLISGLMGTGGRWAEVERALQEQESMLLSLVEQKPTELGLVEASRLPIATFLLPYLRDEPQRNRQIQNQVLHLFQDCMQAHAWKKGYSAPEHYQGTEKNSKSDRPLRIGYLSYCLNSHSVGWLARGLFENRDRERFEVYGYFINSQERLDSLQDWYVNRVDTAHKLGSDSLEIAKQIVRDEIDILIDLDSLTLDVTFQVMALKPAAVQATWLGWDASGLPAVDYFIADPYVLPDSAQDCYAEKIWRLPETYIAVDGFELGVPNLRRDRLEIPADAVVYFSGQSGYKRHPDTARLQMKILKQVPNSYFLIKGKADEETVKNFFTQLAEEEGVAASRLRFLPRDESEFIHRANLGIADIVLDTYPYNGATTTMETLWMGIPLVTRVGEQFSARNSYTMMMNVGVTEGIAWSDREYIEWGVRFGLEPELRQQVFGKLQRSRQSSPLWNAKQFTREMEKAYEQMWQNYLDSQS